MKGNTDTIEAACSVAISPNARNTEAELKGRNIGKRVSV